MNGVEILTSVEVVASRAFNWTAFWIAASVIFGIFIVVGIIISVIDGDCDGLIMCGVTGMVISVLFGTTLGAYTSHPTEYETHYKVTISDEVSMNEFMEKYEIINQDGKIYTIKKRN